MMLLAVAWIAIGLAHWIDWMFNYSEGHIFLFDVIIGLPTFLLFGPITTIKKLLQK